MRRALPVLALAALPLFGGGSAAAPGGGIVIRGAESGSHLRLTISGSRLLVNGHLAGARPLGCRLTGGHSAAACGLAEAGSVVVVMGRSGDKVEVLDPLPVPLTAYLGAGSDKLIGNAEVDTCFPQGTRRNRCVGGPGNDVCIAGQRNTDCVGGPGNDYCRTRNGSDGCWGGPGRDVCVMGRGHDGCHGEGATTASTAVPPATSSTAGGASTTATAVGAGADRTNARRARGAEEWPSTPKMESSQHRKQRRVGAKSRRSAQSSASPPCSPS